MAAIILAFVLGGVVVLIGVACLVSGREDQASRVPDSRLGGIAAAVIGGGALRRHGRACRNRQRAASRACSGLRHR